MPSEIPRYLRSYQHRIPGRIASERSSLEAWPGSVLEPGEDWRLIGTRDQAVLAVHYFPYQIKAIFSVLIALSYHSDNDHIKRRYSGY
jgi:hypothetical protein